MKHYKYFKSLSILGLVLALIIVLTGCVPQLRPQEPTTGRDFVDDFGYAIKLPVKPNRIVTLTSGYDTILLGLIETKRFVAISALSKAEGYSLEYEKAKEVKTSLHSYGLERVVKLKPDLVIAPDYTSKDVLEAFRSMGIAVVVIKSTKTVEGTLELIGKLAYVVDEDAKGQAMVKAIKRDIALMESKKEGIASIGGSRSALFLSSMVGYAGVGSLFDDMCRYMGVENAPVKANLPPSTAFTDERILLMDPDYIFVPTYQSSDKAWLDRYRHNPALASSKAVSSNHVLPLKAAYLYTSNQHIGTAMLNVMSTVYPELFVEGEIQVK